MHTVIQYLTALLSGSLLHAQGTWINDRTLQTEEQCNFEIGIPLSDETNNADEFASLSIGDCAASTFDGCGLKKRNHVGSSYAKI